MVIIMRTTHGAHEMSSDDNKLCPLGAATFDCAKQSIHSTCARVTEICLQVAPLRRNLQHLRILIIS